MPGTELTFREQVRQQLASQPLGQEDQVREEIKQRRSRLRNTYAWGLVSESAIGRQAVAGKAASEVTDPAERQWLVEEVREAAKGRQFTKQQQAAKAGYAERFATKIGKVGQAAGEAAVEAFVETPMELVKGAVGKGRSAEDIKFLYALEAAKLGEDPFLPEDAPFLEKMTVGGAGMAPGMLGGVAAFTYAGPWAAGTFWAGSEFTDVKEDLIKAGLSPSTAALAAGGVSGVIGATEAALPIPGVAKGPAGTVIKRGTGKIAKVLKDLAKKKGLKTLNPNATVALSKITEAAVAYPVELITEGLQAAEREAALYAAGELSDKVEERDPADIWSAFEWGVKEAAPGMLLASAGGGAISAAGAIKQAEQTKIEKAIVRYAAEGITPSRKTWEKVLKLPVDEKGRVPPRLVRKETIMQLAENLHAREQAAIEEATRQPIAPEAPEMAIPEPMAAAEAPVALEVPGVTVEPEAVREAPGAFQPGEPMLVYRGGKSKRVGDVTYFTPHKDVARDAFAGGKSEDVRASYVTIKNPLIVSSSAMENANIDGTVEFAKSKGHDGLITPDLNDEYAQIVAFSESQIQEAPVAPEVPGVAVEPGDVQEGAEAPVVPEDQTVALNKATGAQIRESADLPVLGEEAVQTFDSVMDRVAIDKADEKSLDVAGEVLRSRRQISSYEHVAMVLKATKLMNELDAVRRNRAKAALESNFSAHSQATIQAETITGQLDLLTAASRYSRREIARALSIGRLRLSRESFDIVSVLQEFQAAKGPRGKVTKEEQKTIERLTGEQATLVEEVEQEEERSRVEEEKQEGDLAQKILTANKPRRKIGRGMQEKAIAEREDIKKRIRQLGLRVNDITGVSAEGLYLIGRLGITYIKEGVGTLIGVAERLRADLPDLNLTDMDVNKALISRSPKEKARARSEGAKRAARLTSMAKMLVEIDSLSHGIGVAAKKRVPVNKDVRKLQALLTRARRIFNRSEIDHAKLERAIETVNRLQDQLANGLTNVKKVPERVSPELANARELAIELRTELRVDEELKKVNRQLETGEYVIPIKQKKRPVNRRLERKQIELARKRKEIRQMIANAAPWGTRRVLREITAAAVAMKATADISFTMRQNLWQVFGHPMRTSKAFIPALKAFFSEYSADQISNALLHSENAFLYEQSGLAILDANSPDAKLRSEVYRTNVIERTKIFGKQNPFSVIMAASGRHAVTIGNLVRTSAFDHFMKKNPNATQLEMRAMADYINVSTGIGNLGRAAVYAQELQLVFFSPKFAASRVQTPWALKKYWELPRVRKQIARDMVGVISTGGMILTLARLAGFGVELFDPDDPDWGKIRIGNTRFDIWGSFQQPARVIARLAMASFRADVEFNPLEILGRFAAFKLSPLITTPIELIRGETAVGEERTVMETLVRTTMPMVLEDIEDAWKEEGPIGGIGVGALVIPGVSVSTYKDSQTATRKRIKKLKQKEEYAEAEWIRTMWNYENPKNRIITVK